MINAEGNDDLKIVFQDSNYTPAKLTSYSVTRQYLSPCSTFTCKIYEDDFQKFVQLRDYIALYGRKVQVLVNGTSQFIGIVERTTIGDEGTVLTVSGRSYLSSVVVSDIDQTITLDGGQTLDKAILTLFKPFGITKIDPTGNNKTRGLLTGLGGAFFNKLNASLKNPKTPIGYHRSEPGAKVFEFANKVAITLGFTIQETTDIQTVCLCEPEYAQAPIYYGLYRYLDKDNPKNNFNGVADRDFSEVPTVVTNYGNIPGVDGYDDTYGSYSRAVFAPTSRSKKDQPALFPTIQNNKEFERIFSQTTVVGKRLKKGELGNAENIYRPAFYSDKKSTTLEHLKNRMRRQLSGKFAKTLQCSYSVSGHSQNGIIWTPDTVVTVFDEVGGVDESLWIEGVTFNYSAGTGATTELKCLRLYSYIVGE